MSEESLAPRRLSLGALQGADQVFEREAARVAAAFDDDKILQGRDVLTATITVQVTVKMNVQTAMVDYAVDATSKLPKPRAVRKGGMMRGDRLYIIPDDDERQLQLVDNDYPHRQGADNRGA